MGHVVSGLIHAGMKVSEILCYLCTYLYLFHVPCFFFASGYLYAKNPVREWKGYGSFLKKKALALGLSYVICTSFYVCLSSHFSSEMNPNTSHALKELVNIWRKPIAQYWYLYALLALFAVIPVIELVFRCVNRKHILFGFILLACLNSSNLSFWKYVLQEGYLFYMGIVWNNLEGGGKINKWIFRYDKLIWCGVYCVESILFFGIYIFFSDINKLSSVLTIVSKNIITMLLVITMVRISYVIAKGESWIINKLLMWVSGYSLYIYLFHTWFSGTVRIILRRMGMTNCWIQTFIGCICGLFGSVFLAKVIKGWGILQFWIEPLVVIRRRGR